ncbi:MAG: heme exporter protein CcmB [Chlorobi bacterium]|nr:heme exporter protein CcmB [Chlorobiota bacterium]
MGEGFIQAIAIARKDLYSELRTRYSLNATGMFVAVVVTVVAFSIGPERLNPAITAGLLWICLFFASVTGLSRSFVVEQERGTILLLRLTAPSTPVYFGKLLVNMVLALVANGLIVILFLIFIPDAYGGDSGTLLVITFLLSMGLGAALTIVSAIIARASARSLLSTVLSFPIILPLIILGVDLLRRGADGKGLEVMIEELLLISAYIIVAIAMSYILFDMLWKE